MQAPQPGSYESPFHTFSDEFVTDQDRLLAGDVLEQMLAAHVIGRKGVTYLPKFPVKVTITQEMLRSSPTWAALHLFNGLQRAKSAPAFQAVVDNHLRGCKFCATPASAFTFGGIFALTARTVSLAAMVWGVVALEAVVTQWGARHGISKTNQDWAMFGALLVAEAIHNGPLFIDTLGQSVELAQLDESEPMFQEWLRTLSGYTSVSTEMLADAYNPPIVDRAFGASWRHLMKLYMEGLSECEAVEGVWKEIQTRKLNIDQALMPVVLLAALDTRAASDEPNALQAVLNRNAKLQFLTGMTSLIG